MAAEEDIANRALEKLGADRIISLSDSTKGARAMNSRYVPLRDAELIAHPWRFATRRTTLAADTATPEWGFDKQYTLPSDCLRLLRLGDRYLNYDTIGVQYQSTGYQIDTEVYQIVEGKIHTNLSAPLKIEYIFRETVTGNFDPLFVEALGCRLAVDAAEEITQSTSKKEDVARQYQNAIREARRVNSILNPPRRRVTGSWGRSRFH